MHQKPIHPAVAEYTLAKWNQSVYVVSLNTVNHKIDNTNGITIKQTNPPTVDLLVNSLSANNNANTRIQTSHIDNTVAPLS